MIESPAVLTIDMLRHGETTNNGDRLYGATDIPLSNNGKEQLKSATKNISSEPLSHVISSPKQRCAWLAHELPDHISTNFEPGFAEMDFGDWEGQAVSDLLANEPGFQPNLNQLNPPNGESFTTFSQRVLSTWQAYVNKHLTAGGHHLLITHGGVMRVLLGGILHIPENQLSRLYIPHATWSRVTLVQGEPPVLWFMNRHA